MGKKRKQDQRRDDSSSSGAKRRRSRNYHVGANDMTPREGFADVIPHAVIELIDAMQVKVSTESRFKRKIDKLKLKRQKDKEKRKKDNQDLRILMDNFQILKEEFRILKEGHEDHKSKIQEMQKGGCPEVDHYRESPSQRSQPSESPRYNLQIENVVSSPIYKGETIITDVKSNQIKVGMYYGQSRIESHHHLASVKVRLVVINGSFNDEYDPLSKEEGDPWSKEDFAENIIKGRGGKRLVKNGTFCLTNGMCHYGGAIITDNSKQKEYKLGVMVAVPTEERVLEGVSNPFKVQESKTKESKKKNKKPSPPVPVPNSEQPTSTHATQHGQGPVSPHEQHSLSPPVIQDVLQKEDHGKHTEFPTCDTGEDNGLSYPPATVQQMVEGNGQALNGNRQRSSQQISTQTLCLPTSTYSMQHGQDYCPPPHSIQNLRQQDIFQIPINEPLLAGGQDQYTSFPSASSQLVFPNLYAPLNDIQLTFNTDDVRYLYGETQMQETNGTFRYGRVLLQWDNPHVELKEHWNFPDQLMPLYSTKSRFYIESFPSTSLMDKAHKLLASISSGDYVSKMITSGTSQATQTPQRRGVLIRPIGPFDSDDEPPVKKQRNAKYQLRFVNRVCSDYYTREQIKSEDGTFLKVALYDENNLVVTSGPLSSASVEVLLLHGDFNAEGQDYWTSEEFSTCLVHPQSAKEPPALGGDHVLALTDGEADLGNVNFQTSSFHARTGKFKMGVVIANVRDDSVQEGITSPFAVRVRLGEELSRHRITSLDALLRVRIKLPNQVCVALERDAKENVSTSLALHDQSSQVINDLVVSTASDRPPEPPSQVIIDLVASTASDRPPESSSQVASVLAASAASDRPPELPSISELLASIDSDRPPEPSSQEISVLGVSTASDRPPDPSWQGIDWSAPSALFKVVEDEEDSISKIGRRIKSALLSIGRRIHDSSFSSIDGKLKMLQAKVDRLERMPCGDEGAHNGRICECFESNFKVFERELSGLEAELASSLAAVGFWPMD